MDALSEILRAARLTGGVFLHGEFSEPWCLSSELKASDCSAFLGPADQMVLYHYVLEGCLTVIDPEGNAHMFLPGQAVVIPRNDRHHLQGSEPAQAVSALEVAEVPEDGELMAIRHGGGGQRTRIVCGFLGGRGLRHDPLLNALPSVFRYNGNTNGSGPVIRMTLELAAKEVAEGRPGSDATLARISELLFVEAVRDYVESSPAHANGFSDALKDRAVSKALALIHRNPKEKWTVEALARTCGVSRSVLAERFNTHLGCPPGEYLVETRLRLAANDLINRKTSVLEAAALVGYGSEAAFSRAFKRQYGVSPSLWRNGTNTDVD